jgi:DNA-dependent RNA polymerase auxiliary subunit epsilon
MEPVSYISGCSVSSNWQKKTTGIEILYVNIKQNPEVCRRLKKNKYFISNVWTIFLLSDYNEMHYKVFKWKQMLPVICI